ncbi:hypothetical protein N9J56_00815 [Pelagibacteraceae bacterium]|nr:hypothetical protein [Pelagibacteraceae bacterium]
MLKSFASKIKKDQKTVLYGAGVIGEICLFAFKQNKIKVDFFCDTSIDKQGKIINGVKVLSPSELQSLDKSSNVFISNNYYVFLKKELNNYGFQNILDCEFILNNTDFSKADISINPLKIERWVSFYNAIIKREVFKNEGRLYIKSLDVQITEKCSLGCKDCSNLMQYYSKAEDSHIDTLFRSVERFMSSVDKLGEFRVLGGDPFMNKDMHKVINFLAKFSVDTIAIYTNARFIPKGDNFECLKNPKIILDISDYVLLDKSTRKADELIELLDKNNIRYNLWRADTWTDSGRILPFQKRTEEEVTNLFNYCCNSDIISLLHGKLYRCPFSANATNLKAIPVDETDIVNLDNANISDENMKVEIKRLVYEKKYLTACNFCNGRDFSTKSIDAAVQKPSNKALYFKTYE